MPLLAGARSLTVVAGITGQLTNGIAHHGVYAVFGLMALDALLPVGGELIMLYAGVLAAGAIAGQHATLLGTQLASGLESYIVLAVTGALGYLAGSLVGWGIGAASGKALIERHGRWLHISPQTFRRAEDWFERYGPRAVFLGASLPWSARSSPYPPGRLTPPSRPTPP